LGGSGDRGGPARELCPGRLARAVVFTAGSCPVPDYVPPLVRPVLPWARRHVAAVARRYGLGVDDLWDETVTALLRATLSFKPDAGAFAPYAHTAIHRACWRYVVRQAVKRPPMVSLEDAGERLELTAPSAEAEAIARDAARRAWLLREHAALAAARGDPDTATRLRDVAPKPPPSPARPVDARLGAADVPGPRNYFAERVRHAALYPRNNERSTRC
jgi:DNA-directed RNA polymerase specialized sigma24 family protein